MNKKGFTLVELIAVITIVALLSVIAISASAGMSANAKQKVYNEKIKSIETAAALWGQDNPTKFSKENCTVNDLTYKPTNSDVADYTCYTSLTVQYLVSNNYIKSDTDDMMVIDPRDTSSTINHNKVIVYHYYNNYYAEYVPLTASNEGEITNAKIVINNGQALTIYRDVSVELTAYNANEYCISTNNSVCTSKWSLISDNIIVDYKLSDGTGLKTLYAIFRNDTQTKIASTNITLEIIDPPTLVVDTTSNTVLTKTLKNKITTRTEYLNTNNEYQYYLSNSKTALSGGSWINYTNGSEFTIGTNLTGTYYMFVKPIKDGFNQSSSINDITIDNKTYHVFGPYVLKNMVEPPSYLHINNKTTTATITNNPKVTLYMEALDNPKQMCFSNTSSNTECTWKTYSTAAQAWTLTTGDGTKTIYAWIKDDLGNISTAVSQKITLDTTPPVATSLAINNATLTNKIAVTLYPVASGSPTQMCFSNTSSNESCTWKTYATNSSWTLATGDGTKTVYAWFRDAVGNVSNPISKSITLDTVAPVITFIRINNATTTATKIDSSSVNLYTSGTGSPTQMCFSNTSSNSGCTWKTYSTAAQAWTLASGFNTKTVYVWYRDAAGNVSSAKNVSVLVKGVLTNMILTAAGGKTAIAAKGNPSFTTSATTNMGMYAIADQNGTSYYFRGKIPNNYVKFANKIWRIVRINGDGSTRLVLNKSAGVTKYNYGSGCYFDEPTYTGSARSPAEAALCFRYGTGSYGSTSIAGTVRNWYNSNITGTNLSFIKTNAKFCNDYTFTGENFAPKGRLGSGTRTPNLKCTRTSGYNSGGIDTLSLPVGLLSADEIALAGYVYSAYNNAAYLNEGGNTWAMSGNAWELHYPAYLTILIGSGNRLHLLNSSNDANYRPVINILSTIKATGTGTSSDPYILYLP